MADLKELKNRWQPMVRHAKHITSQQPVVLAETGVWVNADRALAHMGIETGYTGDPKLKSRGVNRCCPRPGQDCTPDCRAWGLFQIFWPPFRGVDWRRALEAEYNTYLGLKTLAIRYQQCGNWPGASAAFFSGSCDLNGTEDVSTGTDDATYRAALERNMKELNQLGIAAGVGSSTDPKANDPETSTPDGGTNTSGEKCLPGTDLCIDPTMFALSQLQDMVGRSLVFIFGAALLLIGAWRIAR